jgi:hypothetical protein
VIRAGYRCTSEKGGVHVRTKFLSNSFIKAMLFVLAVMTANRAFADTETYDVTLGLGHPYATAVDLVGYGHFVHGSFWVNKRSVVFRVRSATGVFHMTMRYACGGSSLGSAPVTLIDKKLRLAARSYKITGVCKNLDGFIYGGLTLSY